MVQVHIHNLRRKLGKNIVRTIQGFGYIMDEPNQWKKPFTEKAKVNQAIAAKPKSEKDP